MMSGEPARIVFLIKPYAVLDKASAEYHVRCFVSTLSTLLCGLALSWRFLFALYLVPWGFRKVNLLPSQNLHVRI